MARNNKLIGLIILISIVFYLLVNLTGETRTALPPTSYRIVVSRPLLAEGGQVATTRTPRHPAVVATREEQEGGERPTKQDDGTHQAEHHDEEEKSNVNKKKDDRENGGGVSAEVEVDVNQLHAELRAMGMPQCAIDFFEADYLRKQKVKQEILAAAAAEDRDAQGTKKEDEDPMRSAEPFLAKNQERLRRLAGVDHVFMVHYTPLVKRRHKMASLLKVHGIAPEWVTGFDKQNITAGVKKCFVDAWNPTQDFPLNTKKQRRERGIKERSLTIPAQVSVVTKHHSAIYAVVRGGYRNAVILEDDALLRRNFLTKMKYISQELDEVAANKTLSPGAAVDVIMIGGCLKMHAWRKKFTKGTRRLSKHLFERQEARCAHAYMVTANGAKQLLSGIPLTSAIDFQLNQVIAENSIRCAWVEPFLSIQGKLDDQCVTAQLGPGAKCPTSVKKDRDTANFDVENAHSREPDSMWDTVPGVGSVK